jgi:hypothetical protein
MRPQSRRDRDTAGSTEAKSATEENDQGHGTKDEKKRREAGEREANAQQARAGRERQQQEGERHQGRQKTKRRNAPQS